MTGARPIGSLVGDSVVLMEFNAAGTFAQNDFVKFDGSTGEVVVATTGDVLLGVANEDATAASTGVSVNITPQLMVIVDNDNDTNTFDATNVGEYADMTGATENHVVDTSDHSTSVAQLWCVEYNPQGYGYDSDTSIGKYMIAENYLGSPYTE